MKRFIVRYTGKGDPPGELAEVVRAAPDLDLVEAAGRMLLVEGPRTVLERIIASRPDWLLAEEATVPLPDTRKRARRDRGKVRTGGGQ